MRYFGSSILFLASLYTFAVILPTYRDGFHHLADFKNAILHPPPHWSGNDPISIVTGLPLVFIHLLFLGRPTILVALLSIGFLIRFFMRRRKTNFNEKIFWLSSIAICWIIFYTNSEILEMYAAWLFD
jgi:hypothetical protein